MITPDELAILRKPEVQEYIREKMGQWDDGDLYHCEIDGKERLILPDEDGMKRWPCCCHVLLIPDCISRDNERPERGLWGMLRTNGTKVSMLESENGVTLYIKLDGKWTASFVESTPRLALLKALEWQIGAEGER